MAAPIGNQNAKGNSGGKKGLSGRKSAHQELADATDAYRIFFGEHDQEELEKKIQSGKFSLADRTILTGMEGDTIILTTTLKKAMPDISKVDHTSKGERIVFMPPEIAEKNGVHLESDTDTSAEDDSAGHNEVQGS